MKVAIGWDHRGRSFRRVVEGAVQAAGHESVRMGPEQDSPEDDYPDYAIQVGEAVGRGKCERGVLVCGSGIGMAIAANKVLGVRAAVADDEESARLSRTHNDVNVLCIGEKLAADGPRAEKIIRLWLEIPRDGGRHARRVQKIVEYERRTCGRPD